VGIPPVEGEIIDFNGSEVDLWGCSQAMQRYEHLPSVLKNTGQTPSSRRDFFWPCINPYIELTLIIKAGKGV